MTYTQGPTAQHPAEESKSGNTKTHSTQSNLQRRDGWSMRLREIKFVLVTSCTQFGTYRAYSAVTSAKTSLCIQFIVTKK